MAVLRHVDLGRMAYRPALDLQKRLVKRVIALPREQAFLLTVRHDPPVITMGSSARREHVLATPEQLARRRMEVQEVRRGGGAALHGPGQLVGYPILRLDLHGRDVRAYLRDLEEVLIRLLGTFGISARRVNGLTGVWVGDEKIAAIGVAARRWVTYHGFSLNVSADLSDYDLIVPCGLEGRRLTSIERCLGRSVSAHQVQRPLLEGFGEVFGFEGFTHCGTPDCGERESPAEDSRSQEPSRRLPPWLKRRVPMGGQLRRVRELLSDLDVATVCSGAHCPNLPECFARGTAAFLILGRTCTRSCRFCAIESDTPASPREDEPSAVAAAAQQLGLQHVVITSVTRDDLSDGGAGHFAATIQAVRRRLGQSVIEVLVPDFRGSEEAIATVLEARPDVLNHNVETVPRLYEQVRPQAVYRRSLNALAYGRKWAEAAGVELTTKSGLMVGLGETDREVRRVMADLRRVACDILTIGQYLAPSARHTPVVRYVEPAQFERWKSCALAMGFRAVASGPYVRSSYHADQLRVAARGAPPGAFGLRG